MYAQIVDDVTGATLVSASTLSPELKGHEGHKGNIEAAKAVGRLVAERALAASISKVVFDRNGFLYHGRVQALAESAREGGLDF
jgi:large subunit ribosomal protein L18